jgi:hypothetical protein
VRKLNTSFIDSRMIGQLGNHFPSTCTIQAVTETFDANEEIIRAWSNLAGHIDIPCSVALSSGKLSKPPAQAQYTLTTHRISLAGSYPAIIRQHRAVIAGIYYEIQYTTPSGFANSVTLLDCNLVDRGA